MAQSALFTSLQLGSVTLPLTRMRAGAGNVPTALNAVYYRQRASAGLIIAEGTAVSEQGRGYPNAPGIYTREQIDGWRTVTQAVHSRGGRIFLQIALNGRNSHSLLCLTVRHPSRNQRFRHRFLVLQRTAGRFRLRYLECCVLKRLPQSWSALRRPAVMPSQPAAMASSSRPQTAIWSTSS